MCDRPLSHVSEPCRSGERVFFFFLVKSTPQSLTDGLTIHNSQYESMFLITCYWVENSIPRYMRCQCHEINMLTPCYPMAYLCTFLTPCKLRGMLTICLPITRHNGGQPKYLSIYTSATSCIPQVVQNYFHSIYSVIPSVLKTITTLGGHHLKHYRLY